MRRSSASARTRAIHRPSTPWSNSKPSFAPVYKPYGWLSDAQWRRLTETLDAAPARRPRDAALRPGDGAAVHAHPRRLLTVVALRRDRGAGAVPARRRIRPGAAAMLGRDAPPAARARRGRLQRDRDRRLRPCAGAQRAGATGPDRGAWLRAIERLKPGAQPESRPASPTRGRTYMAISLYDVGGAVNSSARPDAASHCSKGSGERRDQWHRSGRALSWSAGRPTCCRCRARCRRASRCLQPRGGTHRARHPAPSLPDETKDRPTRNCTSARRKDAAISAVASAARQLRTAPRRARCTMRAGTTRPAVQRRALPAAVRAAELLLPYHDRLRRAAAQRACRSSKTRLPRRRLSQTACDGLTLCRRARRPAGRWRSAMPASASIQAGLSFRQGM